MAPWRNANPLIVAFFDKNFSDTDMRSTRSGLQELGLKRVYFAITEPATETTLYVALAPDPHQEQIDEAMKFLEGADDVRSVRIGSQLGGKNVDVAPRLGSWRHPS